LPELTQQSSDPVQRKVHGPAGAAAALTSPFAAIGPVFRFLDDGNPTRVVKRRPGPSAPSSFAPGEDDPQKPVPIDLRRRLE